MVRRASRGLDDDAIRDRLNRLLKQHTRSEIARKTGTSPVNVGRYASGTQIPAAFCAELSRKFAVNPNWLLLGEGAQDFRGVHPESAQEKDILNLVESLNAVTRLELGALSGDSYAKMLRDLAEALATRDRLHKRLGDHSRGLLVRILNEFGACIDRQDFNRAADLRQLAVHVAKLCADPLLEAQVWEAEAKIEFLQGRVHNAVPLYRRVLHQMIAGGQLLTPQACTRVSNFCYVLTSAGLTTEALKITEALNALATPELRQSREWAALQGGRAQYLIDGGRLKEAHETLIYWIPRVVGFRRKFLTGMLQSALVLAGGMGMADAMAIAPRIHSKGLWAVMLSLVAGTPDQLRAAGEYLIAVEDENGVNRTDWSARAFWFADLMQGRQRAGGAELLQGLKQDAAAVVPGSATGAAFEVMLTLYASYTSDKRAALRQLREAHQRVLGTEIGNVPIWVQALHARNALRLTKPGGGADQPIRTWAEALLARHIEAGYGLFREVKG